MSTAAGAASAGAMLADPDFSALTLLLLTGVLHRDADERLWRALRRLQRRVRDYVGVLGLEVVVDETEGYAYLAPGAGAARALASLEPPSIPTQRPLSFHAGLLLALLRRALAEFGRWLASFERQSIDVATVQDSVP